jgi:hypothetical protein
MSVSYTRNELNKIKDIKEEQVFDKQSSSNIAMPKQALSKQDLELVLEVNKKSIEINNAVLVANDEIQTTLETYKEEFKATKKLIVESHNKLSDKIAELDKKTIETNILKEKIIKTHELTEKFDRDMFKLMVLISTGAIGLILQVIQMLMKK